VERGGERGPGRLAALTCSCAKGGAHAEGGGAHVHHFVESALLKTLEPGSDVALELDEQAATLRVRPG